MINIVIIEDSEEDYKYLADGIREYSEKNGEAISVRHYASALMFLDEYKMDADIIFMDIELPDINGVLASEKLRMRDSDVALVFVTNLAHMAIKGYGVSATDFIVKPVNYYKLSALLGKIIKKVKLNRDDYICLPVERSVVRISLGQIIYVEAEAHRITFHLTDRQITYSGTLTACQKMLPPESFVRCYQSFIVNLKYVKACSGNEIVMTDGSVIPLSRSNRKEVMAKIAGYFHGGGKWYFFVNCSFIYPITSNVSCSYG